MGTKYPKSAQTGDDGVALVKHIATKSRAIFRSFENADLGIDGALELLTDTCEPSGDLVLVQIKTGSSYIRNGRFYVDADKAHFETWMRYSLPVVGIVCDPAKDEARWVDISDHLRKHPEAIPNGPYSIEAPGTQLFSSAMFAPFITRFRRSTAVATRVDTTPNLLIRPWEPGDAGPTRVLLSSISFDYPGFDGWLDKKLADSNASKKVVAIGAVIAAFSMWQRKDARNVKLQTFMVSPLYRGTAIGQHLMYHELRTWALDSKLERAYVTVASNKADLIDYFRMFGFRVEGFAPNRYSRSSNAAELVMSKHLLRDTVRTPADLQRIANDLALKIWGIDPTATSRFGVNAEDLAVPALLPRLTVDLDKSEQTVTCRLRLLDPAGTELIRHDDKSLMTEFYPLRIHLPKKRYVLVPIYQLWAEAMLSTSGPQTPLKLRTDNVYYCYPKVSDLANGDLVIFYEPKKGGGRGAAIGAAVVLEVVINTPQHLHQRFSDRGVYQLAEVKQHANAKNHAMAIRFGLFEPFDQPVTLDRIRTILAQRTNVQGLTPILRDRFEQVRSEGLS